MACVSITSFALAPLLIPSCNPCVYIGASVWIKFRGTNSVNPPVSFWMSLIFAMCLTLSSVDSTWPNIMVDVELIPILCAVLIISVQSETLILPGDILSRIFWSSISAAVPGMVLIPASFSLERYSFIETFDLVAPYRTSSGEKPCMWMSGMSAFMAAHIFS